jgi:hypothetical protein
MASSSTPTSPMNDAFSPSASAASHIFSTAPPIPAHSSMYAIKEPKRLLRGALARFDRPPLKRPRFSTKIQAGAPRRIVADSRTVDFQSGRGSPVAGSAGMYVATPGALLTESAIVWITKRSVTTWNRQGCAFFEDGPANPHRTMASRTSRSTGRSSKPTRWLRRPRMSCTTGLLSGKSGSRVAGCSGSCAKT